MARTKRLSDDQVLICAFRVIQKMGPIQFALADVARVADLSPATLIQRFKTKKQLLVETLQFVNRQLQQELTLVTPNDSSPLTSLIELLVQLGSKLWTEAVIADPEVNDITLSRCKMIRVELERRLTESIKAGELLRTTNAQALALTIEAVWTGALIQWTVFRQGEQGQWLRERIASAIEPWRILRSAARRPAK